MKKHPRRILLAAAALFISAGAASGLEVKEGRMKLVVNESSFRFSLYYLSDLGKGSYVPLFVDQDPRTSFLAVLLDDRAARLGEAASFRARAEKTASGARVSFESSAVAVLQDFVFVKTPGSTLADGVRMDVTATNKSDRELSIGLRFLLDTNLGEKSAAHIATDRRSLDAETLIQPSKDADSYWVSRGDAVALMGSIAAGGATVPSSVHVANWKRLNDVPWKAEAGAGRNFNLLPYSIGDSAVSYYFDAEKVARGAERKVSVLLAVENPAGFGQEAVPGESAELGRLLSAGTAAAESPEIALLTDLITVRDLVARIDAAIASGAEVSADELQALEVVVSRLEERNPRR